MTNKLFVLQGAPGCGKSTFIRDNGLERYVVSPDAVRVMIDPEPLVVDAETGSMVAGYDFTPETSKHAFNVCLEIMRDRMRHGRTVVLDSTAARRKTISSFLNAANDYNYDVYYVDMQYGLSVSEILDRNRSRGARAVPEKVVLGMIDSIRKYEYQGGERLITPDEMLDMMMVPVRDVTGDYDRIIIVGDVQGCFDTFVNTTAYREIDNPRSLIIMAGDYLDRGSGNHLMFDWLVKHLDNDNLMLARGNHDSYFRLMGHGDMGDGLPRKTVASVKQIIAGSTVLGGKVKHLRKLASRVYHATQPIIPVRFNGMGIIVTHGGIAPSMLGTSYDGERDAYKLGFNSDEDMYYGAGTTIGTGDYIINIDELIRKHHLDGDNGSPLGVNQFHGHRNHYAVSGTKYAPYSYNLEANVDKGGALRSAIITPNPGYQTGYHVTVEDTPAVSMIDWHDVPEATKRLVSIARGKH